MWTPCGDEDNASAPVTVLRYLSAPHGGPIRNRFTQPADARGQVAFREMRVREWVMPLMMHGVPFYGFAVCVRDGAGRRALVRWPVDEAGKLAPRLSVSFTADAELKGCDDADLNFRRYPPR